MELNRSVEQAKKIQTLVKTAIGFNYETIECGGKHYLETGKEWEDGSLNDVKMLIQCF